MERYDYEQAVKDDVLDYIRGNIDFRDFDTIEELQEKLADDLFVEDSVTGNASGSYYCNAWKAEEALCHNWDLMEEALRESGYGDDWLAKHGAEETDVAIRCYVLPTAVFEATEEILQDFEAAHEDEEEPNDEEAEDAEEEEPDSIFSLWKEENA